MHGGELLSFQGVRKSFRGRPVLAAVDLAVERGESVALLGPNGSGKSTTLRIAAGLLAPDGGEVRLAGQAWGPGRRPAVRVGYCPQENVLYQDLSVEENLAFAARLQGLGRRETLHQVPWIMTRLGLTELARHRASELSGGQQRRLTLATATVHKPDLLLIEEPEAGVDAASRDQLRSFLREAAQQATLLWTSHDADLVGKAATRAVRLELGVIVADGCPAKLAKPAKSGKAPAIGFQSVPSPSARGMTA